MAVRFAGTTDQLTYSGSLPDTTGGITVVCWVYLSVDRDATSCITRLSASGTSIVYLTTGSDGTIMVWLSAGGSIITSFNLTAGAWHRIAATHNAGTGTLYTANATGAVNVDTGTITTGSPGDLGIGGRGPGDSSEPFNGRISPYKLYAGVLTQAEIEAEWQQFRPRRIEGLHAWYTLLDSGDRIDYSGNGRTLTAGATPVTTEDGPPIPWGSAVPLIFLPPVAAGQSITIELATETDTANSITPAKSVSVGQAAESDAATTITPSKSLALAQAVETDTTNSITPSRSVPIGQATETDTTGALTPAKAALIGQATETDTANSIAPPLRLVIGQATETDTAQEISPALPSGAELGGGYYAVYHQRRPARRPRRAYDTTGRTGYGP